MGEFVHGLRERVVETRRLLAAAERDGDDYGAEIHGEELANLARLAREHGLDPESLDEERVIDLTGEDASLTHAAGL